MMNTAVSRASDQTSDWIERLARFGYAAKGAVYATIGALAIQAAFDAARSATNKQGALQEIASQPFGQVLLGLVVIGLLGYVVWRLVQAGLDPEQKGSDAKGSVIRTGYIISGLVYAGLALAAIRILIGSGGGSNDNAQDWTARLMAQPFGLWLVGIVGVIIIAVGAYQAYRAYTATFRDTLKLGEMSPSEKIWATRAGCIGFAARAVVYAIIGSFLVQAARQADPNQAGGLGTALQTLANQAYGPWLLGIVAVGLIAYGIFAVVEARYRQLLAD